MTKKAEKAARVEAAKRAAYFKKVTTLLGHVARNAIAAEVASAYEAKVDAEAIAAKIASREPVGKVVHPLKVLSVAAAEKWAMEYAAKVRTELQDVEFDADSLAPWPSAAKTGGFGRAYQDAKTKYDRYHRFLESDKGTYYFGEKKTYFWCQKMVDRFVQQSKEIAAQQYDAFIVKLVAKIGPCDSAELDGNHVWSHSILTVRKGQAVERWKTQQIENVSILGKYFPQWPTRLVKGGSK